jgi:hypothetical protein
MRAALGPINNSFEAFANVTGRPFPKPSAALNQIRYGLKVKSLPSLTLPEDLSIRGLVFRTARTCDYVWRLVVVISLSQAVATAQDSLRQSMVADSADPQRTRRLENQPYIFRWGDLRLLTTASAACTWNDNLDMVNTAPLQDLIVVPRSDVSIRWPITDINSLSFSLGLGYEFYVKHPQFDDLVLSPGSELSWDVYIKKTHLNLHDRFSYVNDSSAYGMVSGVTRLGGFNNTVGLSATHEFNRFALSFDYDHVNFLSAQQEFSYLDRESDFFVGRAAIEIKPGLTLGPVVSGGPTTYTHNRLPDNTTYTLGQFINWRATSHISVQQRSGYYSYLFSSQGQSANTTDQSGYYLSLNMNHELNRNVTYSLSGGREVYSGVYSALVETWYGNLDFTLHLVRGLALTTGMRYENSTQPGTTVNTTYDRFGARAGLLYSLARNLDGSLQYQYWIRQSVTPFYDYNQNRLELTLTYRL